MGKQIKHNELVSAFSQTVGIEKAREIVDSACQVVGIEPKGEYATREVVRLCDTIQTNNDSGFIRIVANEFKIRKQAEKRFYALFENIPEPSIVCVNEGGVLSVRAVNSSFEEVFGYEEEDVVGGGLNEFIVPDEKRDGAEEIDRLVLAGQDVEREVQRETIDGERRDFLYRSISVQKETGEIESYGIYTDITDRKARTRRLEEQNERLEEFATVVTHDLRNPLSIAQSHLSFAMEDLDASAEGYDFLPDVADALGRMDRLIEDLLSLARHGQRIDETVPVKLDSIVDDAWQTVETGPLTLETSPAVLVDADRSRLCQLFENLFRNAVEHAVDGDESVTVRVGTVEDGFYVADDGTGIGDQRKEKVLEYGYTTDQGGTGLGLSIVKSIAQAHGWTLSVTDSEDDGARFEITGVDVLAEEL